MKRNDFPEEPCISDVTKQRLAQAQRGGNLPDLSTNAIYCYPHQTKNVQLYHQHFCDFVEDTLNGKSCSVRSLELILKEFSSHHFFFLIQAVVPAYFFYLSQSVKLHFQAFHFQAPYYCSKLQIHTNTYICKMSISLPYHITRDDIMQETTTLLFWRKTRDSHSKCVNSK